MPIVRRTKKMNDYIFEIEYNDGYIEEVRFSAVNLVMAHEMLDEYLTECCVDIRDISISVEVISEED
jgi:oligoribonuclease (3'-5' exoribonuclease)